MVCQTEGAELEAFENTLSGNPDGQQRDCPHYAERRAVATVVLAARASNATRVQLLVAAAGPRVVLATN